MSGLDCLRLPAVVAFTGGNGPALTAYLLNNLFDGSVVGCIGNVQALPQQHVEHARFVADLLGPLFSPIATAHCMRNFALANQ